jgi:hypothetical protein
MEFIDKTKGAKKAEEIIKTFLKSLKAEDNPYPKDLFNNFKSAKDNNGILLQKSLKTILLEEQHNRCCYCMQNLEEKDGTLEHLIPQSITSNQFSDYLDDNIVLNDKNVCLSNRFVENQTTTFPPYPHTIAHQNLVVSCNSKLHCNNYRGNKNVKPIALYKIITEEVEYKQNGEVFWDKEPDDIPTIVNLGLNEGTLKMIRRIWLYATENNKNIDTQREEIIYELITDITKEDEDYLLKLGTDEQWKHLKQYDYFSVPYKIRKIARQLDNMKAKEVRELLEILSQKLSLMEEIVEDYIREK